MLYGMFATFYFLFLPHWSAGEWIWMDRTSNNAQTISFGSSRTIADEEDNKLNETDCHKFTLKMDGEASTSAKK